MSTQRAGSMTLRCRPLALRVKQRSCGSCSRMAQMSKRRVANTGVRWKLPPDRAIQQSCISSASMVLLVSGDGRHDCSGLPYCEQMKIPGMNWINWIRFDLSGRYGLKRGMEFIFNIWRSFCSFRGRRGQRAQEDILAHLEQTKARS